MGWRTGQPLREPAGLTAPHPSRQNWRHRQRSRRLCEKETTAFVVELLRDANPDLTFFVRRSNYNANGAVHQRVHAVAPYRAVRFAYLICNDRMRLRTSLEQGTGCT